MKSTHPLRAAAVLLLLGSVACATPPRPAALLEANDKLQSEQTEQLEVARPALLQEARQALDKAEAAYAREDMDQAELYATLAIQRYETARDFSARDRAMARLRAMREAAADRDRQADLVGREAQALERYQEANQRYQNLQSELEQIRAEDQSEQAQAKRALVEARRKQAQAVSVRAPSLASVTYQEGLVLMDTALEAYERGLWADSSQSAQTAGERFQRSMEEAGAGAQSQQAQQEQARQAQELLDKAQSARFEARARLMPQRDPLSFDKGTALLEEAREALQRGEYARSLEKGQAALDLFQGYQGSGDTQQARQALEQAEQARAQAIGRGQSGTPAFSKGDYKLDLARRALQSGDLDTATREAKEATLLFELGGGQNFAAQGAQAQGWGPGPAASGPNRLEERIEDMLVQVQVERAEALGAGLDEKCPNIYQEFDALLTLARDRLDRNDLAQTLALAVRASERLKKCQPGPTAQAAAAPSVAEVRQERAAQAEDIKDKARSEGALAEAQRRLIQERAARRDNKAALDKLQVSQQLLDQAQGWYGRGAWTQARALAEASTEETKKLEKERLEAANKPQVGPQAGQQAGQAQATPQAADPLCKPLPARLRKAEFSRTIAGARVKTQAEDQDFRRAAQMLNSAQELEQKKLCRESGALLTEAERIFARIAQIDPPADTKVAQVSPGEQKAGEPGKEPGKEPGQEQGAQAQQPADPACQQFGEQLQKSWMAQGVAQGGLKTAQDQIRYQRALELREFATRTHELGQCQSAASILAESQVILEELGGKKSPAEPGAQGGTAQAEQGKKVDPKVDPKAKAEPKDSQADAQALSALRRARTLKAVAREQHAGTPAYEEAVTTLDEAERLYHMGNTKQAGALAQEAGAALQALPVKQAEGEEVKPSVWRPGYNAALDALVLRDQADSQVKDAEGRAMVDQGRQLLSRANQAWEQGDYETSQKLSESAAERFRAALRLQSVAREKQGQERQEALEAERQRLEAERQRLEAARKQGQEALEAERKKIEAERQSREAQQAERQKLYRQASDSLREAEVLYARCQQEECVKRSAGRWNLSSQLLGAARQSLASDNFSESLDKSSQAQVELKALLQAKPAAPTFSLPQGSQRLRMEGNQLVLDPKITFRSGTDVILPRAQASLDELAQVLKDNKEALTRVDLIGFTDSVGQDAANLKLSRDRAMAVRAALIQRGVPAELLVATGRGEAEPIANNGTAQGRELNRRVEIRLTRQQ